MIEKALVKIRSTNATMSVAARYLEGLSEELGEPMANVALAWVMAQPGVASVIAGARSPDQVARNVKATALSLAPETIARLNEVTAPVKEALGPNADYWQTAKNSRMR